MKNFWRVCTVIAILLWAYIFVSCISSLHIKELDYESQGKVLPYDK